jgi:uncharacterized protein YbcI
MGTTKRTSLLEIYQKKLKQNFRAIGGTEFANFCINIQQSPCAISVFYLPQQSK